MSAVARACTSGGRVAVRGLLLTLLLALVMATPVAAHEGEKSKTAIEDVRQAIAYIVNDPGNMDMITDKVSDALEAEDQAGVDIPLVTQARAALNGDDMMAARGLLERAIGARPDVSGTDVRPILQVPTRQNGVPLATGELTGTNVVTDPLRGRGDLTGTDWVLLGVAVVLAIAGVLLSRRWRPHDTIRQLRRRMSGAQVQP